MKLSTRIKKQVSPWFLWKPNGSYGNDILDAGHEIVLMVDRKSDEAFRTFSLSAADEQHKHLVDDMGCALLPSRECPVVNNHEIIMHYTSTTYRDWCKL